MCSLVLMLLVLYTC